MSDVAFFDVARALKRERSGEGLSQADVDAFNAIITSWSPQAHRLAKPASFFGAIRTALGVLTQSQVDGINALLEAMGTARWPRSWAAYGLATAWWETNHAMQPVEEAYYLGAKAAAYRKTLKYYPNYGRGFVQLTWAKNYERADEECGLGGRLVADPALALQPEIAAQVLVRGMAEGWFTGKALKDYLPIDGKAGFDALVAARHIINGTDRAADIAKIAQAFDAALEAGVWA